MPLPARVNPPKVATSLIGNAGFHFVCMELSLRGLIAIPTTRNTAGIDVLASTADGSATASIQVKTSQSRVSFWPTAHPRTIADSDEVWFVFLRWLPRETRFEAFMASAKSVRARVQAKLDHDLSRGAKEFPNWVLPKEDASSLASTWNQWSPDGTSRIRLI